MGRDGKFAVSGYACVSVGGILLLLAGMSTNVRAAKRSSNSHNFHASAIFRAGDIQNGEVVGHPATKTLPSATTAQDPGARASSGDAGSPLASLSSYELEYFQDGLARFMELDSVAGQAPGEPGSGLGPTFNSNSCGSCHSQPAIGGSSPATNPLLNVATDYGAKNEVPSFLTVDGPVREVRFPFVVTPGGR
jgi:hypothetical protein